VVFLRTDIEYTPVNLVEVQNATELETRQKKKAVKSRQIKIPHIFLVEREKFFAAPTLRQLHLPACFSGRFVSKESKLVISAKRRAVKIDCVHHRYIL